MSNDDSANCTRLKEIFPHLIAAVFVPYSAVLAIAPRSGAVWVAEVVPVTLVFAGLVLTFRQFRFSNAAYTLMAVWVFWHTLGALSTLLLFVFLRPDLRLGGATTSTRLVGHG